METIHLPTTALYTPTAVPEACASPVRPSSCPLDGISTGFKARSASAEMLVCPTPGISILPSLSWVGSASDLLQLSLLLATLPQVSPLTPLRPVDFGSSDLLPVIGAVNFS